MTAVDRGQLLTVEAILAGLLLLGSLVFAMHVVAVTANTASTANPQIGADHASLAMGTLDRAVSDGSLKASVLYWNTTSQSFYHTEDGFYDAESPPTIFGESLNRTFADRQVRFNVDLFFHTETGEIRSQRLVHHGTPTDDAVRVARTVTLYDEDRLRDEAENPTNVTLVESSGFYVPNASPERPLYNVIRVEVVLWQT